jgi:hypothetical protein
MQFEIAKELGSWRRDLDTLRRYFSGTAGTNLEASFCGAG